MALRHVFVVRGTLEQLIADDVLVSTDLHGTVEEHFFPALGWKRGQLSPVDGAPTLTEGQRVYALPAHSEGPRRWLVAVGADVDRDVAWLLAGIRRHPSRLPPHDVALVEVEGARTEGTVGKPAQLYRRR